MRRRILLVEDDPGIAKIVCDNLRIDGFSVRWAPSAHEALSLSRTFEPDLVLLDLMLPERDGFELCGVLRRAGRCAVIILSARSQRQDKIKGLSLGADDYVTKPFDMEELVARIHAVLRRTVLAVTRVRLGEVLIDLSDRLAVRSGAALHLTHRKYEILRYLASRADRVVTRQELLNEVWGQLDGSTTRSVDFAIARLRKKIETDPHRPRFLRTVHGDGYSLRVAGEGVIE